MRFFGVRKPGALRPWTYHLSKSSVLLNEASTTVIDRPPVIVCSDEAWTTDSGQHSPSLLVPKITRQPRNSRVSRRLTYNQIDEVIQDQDAEINSNGASYLDKYEQRRPDPHLACSFFVFKAYKQTIMTASLGVCEYTYEHGELAKKHLKRWRLEIVDAINTTLDQAAFVLNRITFDGLTALL